MILRVDQLFPSKIVGNIFDRRMMCFVPIGQLSYPLPLGLTLSGNV